MWSIFDWIRIISIIFAAILHIPTTIGAWLEHKKILPHSSN